MPRLPFTIVTEAPPRPGDRFDVALERAAFVASVIVLLAGGGAFGFWIGVWLFNCD